MSEVNSAWIQEQSKKLTNIFSDGFQYGDLFDLVPLAMEMVEDIGNLSGEEKRKAAEELIYLVIDETDMPWLPDPLVDPIIKSFVPGAIESLIKASKGAFAFNKDE